MKALVFNGPRDIRYESFPDPRLASANSAVLKVQKCSICGSDLHIFHGEQVMATRYADGVEKFCVGHEFIGEVVEAGPDVHGFKVGDKVLSSAGTGCGDCAPCRTGRPMQCVKGARAFGLDAERNGGQAEYVCVPNADLTLLSIPQGVSDEQAVLLTDAMATANFGVRNADIKAGGTVAVVGLGPIGLIAVELALLHGAARVFAVDPVPSRRARAAALGAETFDATPETLAEITSRNGGRGAQSVIEASGAKTAIELALSLVGGGGVLSIIGVPQPGVALQMMPIFYRNLTVRSGNCPVPTMWPELIPLLRQGRLKAAGLFTHALPLSEGAEAYRLFDSRQDDVVKVMVEVG
jgi:2-desacetyl-2-hydroxyethyl bacteriochlorophyllide A dehydrogenase